MGIIPYNKNAMNSKAIKLYLKEKTKFELTFQDGTKRRYDALDLFEFDPNVFTLIDNNIFKKAKLTEDNKIVWPGKIQINVKDISDQGYEIGTDENILEISLGQKIKKARISKNITQSDFSKIVNIDQADLSKIENGKLSPSLTTLKRISKGLDLKLKIDFEKL